MGLLSRIGKKLRVISSAPAPQPTSSYKPPTRSPVVEEEEPEPVSPRAPGTPVRDFIETTVKSHPVVIFMKGVPDAPRCGFSASASSILRSAGVEPYAVDVLSDEEIRDGIKAYTSWPTIPQIFVAGEFVGGADILSQLAASGELKDVLKKATPTA